VDAMDRHRAVATSHRADPPHAAGAGLFVHRDEPSPAGSHTAPRTASGGARRSSQHHPAWQYAHATGSGCCCPGACGHQQTG
jgi:hypothetical protein